MEWQEWPNLIEVEVYTEFILLWNAKKDQISILFTIFQFIL